MYRSLGDGILVVGACLFGSWTVFCYVMVLSESSFSDLKMWSFVPFVIGLVVGARCMGKFGDCRCGSSLRRDRAGIYL